MCWLEQTEREGGTRGARLHRALWAVVKDFDSDSPRNREPLEGFEQRRDTI